MQPKLVTLTVNGRQHHVALAPNVTLLQALRDLGYTDVKNGCEKGDCGACAVLMDGRAVNSCLVLAWQAGGAEIVTDAGLGTMDDPHPHLWQPVPLHRLRPDRQGGPGRGGADRANRRIDEWTNERIDEWGECANRRMSGELVDSHIRKSVHS